ncbi:hypothetical protein B8A23_04305 [Staphylococcus aureus]|nr:hypothetical protein B8A23_04305 [Staphylococcus aureus]
MLHIILNYPLMIVLKIVSLMDTFTNFYSSMLLKKQPKTLICFGLFYNYACDGVLVSEVCSAMSYLNSLPS